MDDMHLLIDEQTADRLVSGTVAPDDAPPGYARLATLVRAAQVPGSPGELVGEGAVASMAAAIVSNTLIPMNARACATSPTRKRNRMLTKVLTAKAATAATVALFGLGTAAAAATGALPMQGSGGSSQGTTAALEITNSTTATTGTQSGSGTVTPNNSTDAAAAAATAAGITAPTTGPANEHALFGLCTAFLAGPPSSTSTSGTGTTPPTGPGNKYNSTAFKALISESGGSVASTATACTTYLQNAKSSSTTDATSGDTTDSPDSSTNTGAGDTGWGRPASPGNSGSHGGHGHGHGGGAGSGGHGHH